MKVHHLHCTAAETPEANKSQSISRRYLQSYVKMCFCLISLNVCIISAVLQVNLSFLSNTTLKK